MAPSSRRHTTTRLSLLGCRHLVTSSSSSRQQPSWDSWNTAQQIDGVTVDAQTHHLPILGSLFVPKTTATQQQPQQQHVKVVHDNTSAKHALQWLEQDETHVLIYQGRYGQAQALLSALQRRIQQQRRRRRPQQHVTGTARDAAAAAAVTREWLAYRQQKQCEAHCLNRLLVEVQGTSFQLTNVTQAPPHVTTIFSQLVSNHDSANNNNNNDNLLFDTNPTTTAFLFPLREIHARVASREWHTKGVWIDALQNYIHPHFNVYPPTRQDYLSLLPSSSSLPCSSQTKPLVVMDVGTGTGVLAAILLHQHSHCQAVVTDLSPLAIACARENFQRLGYMHRILAMEQTDLFAHDVADVLVCNPPWIPLQGRRGGDDGNDDEVTMTWLDRAIYDLPTKNGEDSMLHGFLQGARAHMRNQDSEAWLILSDLAEHLKLRSQQELEQWIHDGGLEIVERRVAAKHAAKTKRSKRKIREENNFPRVAEARRAENTFLYRLRQRKA